MARNSCNNFQACRAADATGVSILLGCNGFGVSEGCDSAVIGTFEGTAAAADFGSSGASVFGSFILSLESWLRHSNTAILLPAAPTS